MILTNFTIYNPEDSQKLALLEEHPTIKFIKCLEGYDWYDLKDSFQKETIKIQFDCESGVIKAISRNHELMWPENCSVVEIESDITPDDLNIIEKKIFDVETMSIKDRVYNEDETKVMVLKKISYLRGIASSELEPLQYAKELKLISTEETEYMKELKKYIVLLSRIEQQSGYPMNIIWPEVPTKI